MQRSMVGSELFLIYSGTAESKRQALQAAGVRVADSPSQIPALLREAGVR
jgi:succinyl-CoA synthetase alpha subunit